MLGVSEIALCSPPTHSWLHHQELGRHDLLADLEVLPDLLNVHRPPIAPPGPQGAHDREAVAQALNQTLIVFTADVNMGP